MNSSLATLALFLIAAMFLSQPQATHQLSCCIRYTGKVIPLKILKSYERAYGMCPKPAIIFLTKKDKRICADPKEKWVQDRIRDLS